MSSDPRIVVAGAGAIGCYVGGRLLQAGLRVAFLGRDRIVKDLCEHGLTISDFQTAPAQVGTVEASTDPALLNGADIVLVAVKSAATAEIAQTIAAHAPTACVVSLQNGISNPDVLRAVLPKADVRGGVVAFNVVELGPGRFHQASSGGIDVEDGGGALAAEMSSPALAWAAHADLGPIQWGKLLVNLNNALNALSGETLLTQLQKRDWRRLLAAQMAETLAVLKAAGITPARFTAAPPALVPSILRLPTPLFARLAKAMLTIDPQARSSMQDDLRQGRLTEIDSLQGEVQRLGQAKGVKTPVIDQVVHAIRAAETARKGPPGLNPTDLRR